MPPSRAKANSCRDALAYVLIKKQEPDDECHADCSTSSTCRLREDVDEGEPGCGSEGCNNISEAEEVGNQDAKGEWNINDERPDHTSRNNDARMFDFFGCGTQSGKVTTNCWDFSNTYGPRHEIL